jgi:hypothetical protein
MVADHRTEASPLHGTVRAPQELVGAGVRVGIRAVATLRPEQLGFPLREAGLAAVVA